MKNGQPEITVRLSDELLRKVLYLCDAERRSPSNQILMLLRNSIQYFERAKGRMDPAKLAAYDLSEYYPGKDAE